MVKKLKWIVLLNNVNVETSLDFKRGGPVSINLLFFYWYVVKETFLSFKICFNSISYRRESDFQSKLSSLVRTDVCALAAFSSCFHRSGRVELSKIKSRQELYY